MRDRRPEAECVPVSVTGQSMEELKQSATQTSKQFDETFLVDCYSVVIDFTQLRLMP
jgi:hypothetical protein